MIRTVALGVICLAGLGAAAVPRIAGTAREAPALHDEAVQTPAGDKADRLPVRLSQETLSDDDRLSVVYAAPAADERSPEAGPRTTPPEPAASIIPRHWHDPHDPKAGRAKLKDRVIRQAKKRETGGRSKPVKEARQTKDVKPVRETGKEVKQAGEARRESRACPAGFLVPLLKSMNMMQCDS